MTEVRGPHPLLRIPPPIWTLLFLAIAYGLERTAVWAGVVFFRSPALAAAFLIAGLGLAMWAGGLFGREGTEINPTSQSNKTLVTGGPFRVTRNPMYLGLVLMSLGVAFYFGTASFFAAPIIVFLICNFGFIPYEEAKMQRQFGGAYTEYLERVRRWI